MSERERQWSYSPLQSDRGSTTIKDSVVKKIAGTAAQEVEGVHMGGSASRAAGGLLGGITESQNQARGVSTEVGQIEVAIDFTLGISYGKNILQTVERVRNKVVERVENLTGLRVTALNVTISDVVFSDEQERGERRGPLWAREKGEDRTRAMEPEETLAGSRRREAADTEPLDLGEARAQARVESGGGRRDREDVRVEDTPLAEDETAEYRVGDHGLEERREPREDGPGDHRER